MGRQREVMIERSLDRSCGSCALWTCLNGSQVDVRKAGMCHNSDGFAGSGLSGD